jgi:hypothetical protein
MARKKRITIAKIKKLSKKLKNVIAKETDDAECLSRIVDKIVIAMTQEVNAEVVKSSIEDTPLKGCVASTGADSSSIEQNSFIRTKGQSEVSDSQKGVGIN